MNGIKSNEVIHDAFNGDVKALCEILLCGKRTEVCIIVVISSLCKFLVGYNGEQTTIIGVLLRL